MSERDPFGMCIYPGRQPGTPDDRVWLCGAFEPARPRMIPYRCTEPHGHPGPHRALLDGEVLAEWHQLAALEARWRAAYAQDPRPVILGPPEHIRRRWWQRLLRRP